MKSNPGTEEPKDINKKLSSLSKKITALEKINSLESLKQAINSGVLSKNALQKIKPHFFMTDEDVALITQARSFFNNIMQEKQILPLTLDKKTDPALFLKMVEEKFKLTSLEYQELLSNLKKSEDFLNKFKKIFSDDGPVANHLAILAEKTNLKEQRDQSYQHLKQLLLALETTPFSKTLTQSYETRIKQAVHVYSAELYVANEAKEQHEQETQNIREIESKLIEIQNQFPICMFDLETAKGECQLIENILENKEDANAKKLLSGKVSLSQALANSKKMARDLNALIVKIKEELKKPMDETQETYLKKALELNQNKIKMIIGNRPFVKEKYDAIVVKLIAAIKTDSHRTLFDDLANKSLEEEREAAYEQLKIWRNIIKQVGSHQAAIKQYEERLDQAISQYEKRDIWTEKLERIAIHSDQSTEKLIQVTTALENILSSKKGKNKLDLPKTTLSIEQVLEEHQAASEKQIAFIMLAHERLAEIKAQGAKLQEKFKSSDEDQKLLIKAQHQQLRQEKEKLLALIAQAEKLKEKSNRFLAAAKERLEKLSVFKKKVTELSSNLDDKKAVLLYYLQSILQDSRLSSPLISEIDTIIETALSQYASTRQEKFKINLRAVKQNLNEINAFIENMQNYELKGEELAAKKQALEIQYRLMVNALKASFDYDTLRENEQNIKIIRAALTKLNRDYQRAIDLFEFTSSQEQEEKAIREKIRNAKNATDIAPLYEEITNIARLKTQITINSDSTPEEKKDIAYKIEILSQRQTQLSSDITRIVIRPAPMEGELKIIPATKPKLDPDKSRFDAKFNKRLFDYKVPSHKKKKGEEEKKLSAYVEEDLRTKPPSTLVDWSDNLDKYYVKGKSIRLILAELKGVDPHKYNRWFDEYNQQFHNEDILKEFFKEYLFSSAEEKLKEDLSVLALKHFHKKGLPHAVAMQVSAISNNNIHGRIFQSFGVGDPNYKVNFEPEGNGVKISTIDHYEKAISPLPRFRRRKKEVAVELEYFYSGVDKEYAAKTTTNLSFTLDNPNQLSITLNQLEVDCPESSLRSIFDTRGLIRRILLLIEQLIKNAFSKTDKPILGDR